jgi:2-dehydropantoate 2-reductase
VPAGDSAKKMTLPLQHAILGPGGIGGLMGACLARSGASVTLVVRPEALAAYPEQLQLESHFGNFSVSVLRAAEVPAADVLWIAVKATQLESALTALKNPDSVRAIVPLLNGIDHLSLLRSKYRTKQGTDRVIAATIAVESERVAPGHIVHRTPFARLNVSSAGSDILGTTLQQLQQMGFECRFVDDEPTLMWSKTVFLAPFALTTTAAGRTTGGVIADPGWREQLESCVLEACAVAIAERAKVDAESVIASMMKMPANMRSSMQKDVEQDKTPELDAIAGPILRGAQRHGIEVPATKKLLAAVEQRVSRSERLLA